jgi:hypothetical protein
MTESRIGADGWVPITATFRLLAGTTYRLLLRIEDQHGKQVRREVALSTVGAESACPHR